jgi:hypothetical protein
MVAGETVLAETAARRPRTRRAKTGPESDAS